MGRHPAITATRFPKQGIVVGKRCTVFFHFDTAHALGGQVVRDDVEAPFCTIIALDDGRTVLDTECYFTVP